MAPPRRLHEVKALTDTAKPERQAPSLPRSPDGAATPDPPDWLDEYSQAKWRELVPALADRRLLTGGSLSLLELLCEAYGVFRRASAVIRDGSSYEAQATAGGVLHRKRPEADQATVARKEYAVLLGQYNRLLELPPTGSGADEFTQLLEENSGRRNSHR